MSLSLYSAGALIEASLGHRAGLVSAPLYLALLSAPPSFQDTGSSLPEIAYPGYARIALQGSDWTDFDGVACCNAVPIALRAPIAGPDVLVVAAALCTEPIEGEVMHFLDMVAMQLSVDDPDPQIGVGMLAVEP